MKTNAEVNFVIAEENMEFLKNVQQIEDYGEHSKFPEAFKITGEGIELFKQNHF